MEIKPGYGEGETNIRYYLGRFNKSVESGKGFFCASHVKLFLTLSQKTSLQSCFLQKFVGIKDHSNIT